jgi:hypothetical protein
MEKNCYNNIANADSVVITTEMRKKALELMPIAQSCAEAKTTRVAFFKASQKWLKIHGGTSYFEAKEAARKARERLDALYMIASGITADGNFIITNERLEEVMNYFNRESNHGTTTG